MLIWILLLISSVCVRSVTQCPYQAEENQNFTLGWSFTTKLLGSNKSLNILCGLITDDDTNSKILYYMYEGVEVPNSENEQFSGRVQFDKDAQREGRLRLHVSKLRREDSGLYQCRVSTDHGEDKGECRLDVSVPVERPGPEPQTPGPEPQTPGPEPQRPGPEPQTPGPEPQTPGPEPQRPGPEPQTPGPEPQTPGPEPQRPGPEPQRPGPEPQTPGPEPQRPGPVIKAIQILWTGMGLTLIIPIAVTVGLMVLLVKLFVQSCNENSPV